MNEYLLLGLAAIVVLGIIAQWLSWRFKIPSILLLLIFGFLAGPVTGLLNPDELLGSLLYPFLSLCVGLILFESGLRFNLTDFRASEKAVRNLTTFGVVISLGLISAAAHYIIGLDLSMSVLLGAILVVTGPSVLIPLLRHVRSSGRIGAIAKWEGTMIDPIGAIISVLVLETVVFFNAPIVEGLEVSSMGEAVFHAIEGLCLVIFVSLGVSVLSAGLLVTLFKRRLIPDHLKNAVALMVVVGVFAITEMLRQESGLLATGLLATLFLGIIIANQPYVPARRVFLFKEEFRVFLYAVVFILFSARLEITELEFINQQTLIFLVVLMLVIRPVVVAFAAIGAKLNWREYVFLSWLGPRGVVAAALVALFSFRLQEVFPENSGGLVPIVFLVIIGTVAISGLTATPLAQLLKLAERNPQGNLFIGAQSWVRRMAKVIQEQGYKVMLVDSDPRNIAHAEQAGLDAKLTHVLTKEVVDDLELGEFGRMLVLTPNEEINALATLNFHEYFDGSEVYQLPVRGHTEPQNPEEALQHVQGRHLFGEDVTYASLNTRFISGASIKTGKLTEDFTFEDFHMRYGTNAIPLFLIRNNGDLHVFTAEDPIEPEAGETLIALINRVDKISEESDGLLTLGDVTITERT